MVEPCSPHDRRSAAPPPPPQSRLRRNSQQATAPRTLISLVFIAEAPAAARPDLRKDPARPRIARASRRAGCVAAPFYGALVCKRERPIQRTPSQAKRPQYRPQYRPRKRLWQTTEKATITATEKATAMARWQRQHDQCQPTKCTGTVIRTCGRDTDQRNQWPKMPPEGRAGGSNSGFTASSDLTKSRNRLR